MKYMCALRISMFAASIIYSIFYNIGICWNTLEMRRNSLAQTEILFSREIVGMDGRQGDKAFVLLPDINNKRMQ